MEEFENFNSAKISWFRCGGKIKHYCAVENHKDLQYLYDKYKNLLNNLLFVGAGSNILIREGGFDGLVVKLTGQDFSGIDVLNENNGDVFLRVGSGILDRKITDFALKNHLIGAEFLDTIPGTIGGALATNAGCFGKEIKDVLHSADVCIDGKIRTMYNNDFHFKYRSGEIPKNALVLNVVLKLKKGNKEDMENSYKEIEKMREYRRKNQIIGATCGSTFANPVNKDGEKISAWKLIEDVGMRGYAVGGAKFSEQHCNFIINNGKATANDIENLIELAKQRVKDKFDIDLHEEVRIFGKKA